MSLPCLKRNDASTGGEVVEFGGGRGGGRGGEEKKENRPYIGSPSSDCYGDSIMTTSIRAAALPPQKSLLEAAF